MVSIPVSKYATHIPQLTSPSLEFDSYINNILTNMYTFGKKNVFIQYSKHIYVAVDRKSFILT